MPRPSQKVRVRASKAVAGENEKREFCRFYSSDGLRVEALLSDKGREIYVTPARPYEIYLALNNIEQHRAKVCSSTNGFVERDA
jgi:hypothetical protein